ncbi:hypothetical protein RJ639_013112 [Escallonia herrerae]|uniref:Uncharacterized protein n=1 Tax=Escallonia herrerae TaxID=1293975 RepID=A0AA88VGK5_9ASTE|nr:hypothetical protein RJ639_013112 [Escallonia herrerae]
MLAPALEEEAIEVECLLVEPQSDHISVDGILCFHNENLQNCMYIEDDFCRLAGPDSYATKERESEAKVIDVMPCKVEEGNFQAENGFASTCEDYLLDVGFAESLTNLDYDSSNGLHMGNWGSESQIPESSRVDDEGKMLSSSSATIPVVECQNILLGKTIWGIHDDSSSTFECETSAEAKWLNSSSSSELQNVDKVGDVTNILIRGASADKDTKDMAVPPAVSSSVVSCPSRIMEKNETGQVGQVIEMESLHGQDQLTMSSPQDSIIGASTTEKRVRKRTLRYIDESSDLSSRYCTKRRELSTSTLKDKFLEVKGLKNSHIKSRATMLSEKGSFCKAIQVPFGSRGESECGKKRAAVLVRNSDDEASPAGSQDKFLRTAGSTEGGGQRKNHRPWTLSEVRKLIDGVSHYGVGRWAHIKRLLFSSSAHRTSVDLKDKWRNLLKASRAQKQIKEKGEKGRNQPWRHLPKSMLCRVSELATIYPYPRDRQSKLSRLHCVLSPSLPARSTGVSRHLNERIAHRKVCT